MRTSLQGDKLIVFNASEIVKRSTYSVQLRLNGECNVPLEANQVLLYTQVLIPPGMVFKRCIFHHEWYLDSLLQCRYTNTRRAAQV